MSAPPAQPIRVEKALELLPSLEALAPLRALLVSISRLDARAQWSSSGPYLTLGKRGVYPDELRRRMPRAVRRAAQHLQALYAAYVDALECQEQGDPGGAVAALLRAGGLEEAVRRLAQARAWYEVAVGVSAALAERRPELDALRALAQLALALGQSADAARAFQRALALAEGEFDQPGAITACEGLGEAALQQGQWAGAHAWYVRGLRLAEAARDRRAIGRLERQLGVLARRQGDLVAAGDHLRRAREQLEAVAAAEEMVRVLNTQAQLDAQLGRHAAAAAAYREALAWARRAPDEPALELSIRLHLGELHIAAARFLEAEEELRRAENLAIASNEARALVQIYTSLGRLRGEQGDATGFVFFEQAIELCRTNDPSLFCVASVYEEYARFERRVGDRETARAYLERAREIYESLGGVPQLEQVQRELQQLSA